MEIILNNPFRVLGLPVTATDRQITKRVDDLSTYYEMGKSKQYDTDFLSISPLIRTPESIQRAASQLEILDQKLFHSIFWFWPGNSVDELVFELLKDGNAAKAKELWEKQTMDSNLTNKNFSNYRNLALLKISLSVNTNRKNLGMFLDAVGALVSSINHDSLGEFVTLVGGPDYEVSTENIQKTLADAAHKVVGTVEDQEHGVTARRYIAAFYGSTDQIIQHVRGKYISQPMRGLETKVQECQKITRNDASTIYAAAKSLYLSAKEILKNLEGILAKRDAHYQYIADKVANELLRCSTEHFNAMYKIDESLAPINQSEEITLWARDVAIGASVIAKVEDDLGQIEGIRKQKRIGEIGNEIVSLINTLPKPNSITETQWQIMHHTLKSFTDKSMRLLYSLEKIGGRMNEDFLYLSELVVGIVLNTSIAYANRSSNYRVVMECLNAIEKLQMSTETRAHLVKNHEILRMNLTMKEIEEKVSKEYAQQAKIKKSSACYIATLVYGSYEAPEVLVLRQYRDEVLMNSFTGRSFIRMYYAASPSLVELLKNQLTIQRFIRKLLNRLIRKITL